MDIRIHIANLEVRFETNIEETASIEYLATVHPEHVNAGIEEVAEEFTTSHLGVNVAELDDDDDRDNPIIHTCPQLIWEKAYGQIESTIREHVSRFKEMKRHRPLL